MRAAIKTSALFAALALLIVLAAPAAQHHAGDTAKDPVCGMDVKKSEAKATFDYKGTTNYFCAVSCKDKFAQDPEKYLQKGAEKAEKALPHHTDLQAQLKYCPMTAGKMHAAAGHGLEMSMEACPMAELLHHKEVELKAENAQNGVRISLASKDPGMVKKIQDMAAKMTACRESKDCGGDCFDK